jgi:uncharacterized membrane protein YeiH
MPASTPFYRLGFGIVIVRIVSVTSWIGGVVRDLAVSRVPELLVVGIEARPASCASNNSRVANIK